jgi:hypothetical protein
MRIRAFRSLLIKALPARRKILVVSQPGLGKSFVWEDVVSNVLGWDYISLCSPLQTPVKVSGYPRPPEDPDGDATHCLFDGIARAFRATRPTVLHWDDLGMANGETLKAIVDLIQFGKIDGRTLPEHVLVGASSNDVGHGADVVGLIEPLKNRWHSIIHLEPNIDDVVVYGLAHSWPGWLLAWVRNNPDCLSQWKPTKSLSNDGCTSRGLDYVSQWDNIGIDDCEVFAGAVGKGSATSMLAFKAVQSELPDVDAVLLDPVGSPVPTRPDAQWLVSMALATKLSASNFGQALCYLQRLPTMFRVFSIRDAFQAEGAKRDSKSLPANYKTIASSRDFTAWAVSEDGKDALSASE